ncbi:MAG: hypothetical protein FWG05_01680 [Kiritimatiellaeota bacterium]|nr:hypothetical protein [Kiritimatiellota bacterium]
MTSRERLLTAMSRGMPDRVPFDINGFTPMSYETFTKNTGATDMFEYFGADYRFVGFRASAKQHDYRPYFEGRGLDVEKMRINEFGVGFLKSEKTEWHYEHFISPLKHSENLDDFINYPLPDDIEPYRHAHIASSVKALHDRGLAAVASLECTLFENAWQIRGIDEFMTDMYERPDIVDCLLDRFLAMRVKQVECHAEAGTDLIKLGDDIAMQTGMMMSPEIWREFFKPRMARIIAAAKRIKPDIHILYHSDGDPSKIFDELIEIGVTVLNPIQPECVDPAEVKKRWGGKVAFWGAIGLQHTMPFGTPDDVRAEVRLRMETIGKGGGFIIGPSHVLAPEIPWANIKALHEAVAEYGNY